MPEAPVVPQPFPLRAVIPLVFGGIPVRSHGLQALLQQRPLVATGIALLVHTVGLVGMVWIDRAWFASMTPVNLLLMSALLLWTQELKDRFFYAIAGLSFFTGMLAEITGVHTGWLFGSYAYGSTMGFGILGVPVVIGLNWFVVVFSASCAASLLADRLRRLVKLPSNEGSGARESIVDILLAASIAVIFDWIMEPTAVRLGFWTWAGDGTVPLLNYLTWFALSVFLCAIIRYMRIVARNPFAVHLLLIQALFFVMVRWLL
jgi:putative membrane protein